MKPVDKISYITGKEKKGKKSYNDLTSEMSDVYEKLTNEAEEHKKTLKAIEERLKFEELISRLSARFINLPVNEIDREINNALLDIIKHLHMDRSYIYEYFKDENTFKMSYGYTSDGIPVIPSYMNEFYFPWVARQTLAGKTLFCSGIEDIPENEITDRENHLKFGIKNVLIFPMYIEGEVGAICSISTNKEDFSWSESFIKQITLVGQVLSSAIARKRNYEKNRILHEELYHIKKCITLGELSASLTHEINQPLCSIMTDAETCLHLVSSGDSNVSHILEDIISASKRANSIITSFRKMFKKEHHEFEPLNINELIKNSLSMLNSTMGMKEIKINVKDLPEPPDIMGDRIKIQQVIINLLLNGADSMANLPEKSREILIVTEMDDKDHIKVSLRDRGHGLNEIKKIFLPFYTQKSEGMGMGLFIAKNIIEEHNGKLWAENNHDRGSTFYFTIPVKKERENYPAVKKETGVSLVYIVDDDSMVRKSMVRLLKLEGFRVKSFASPEDFLKEDLYEKQSCIILDMSMPSISGLEIQERLKKMGIDIPVIFISGKHDIAATVQAIKNGAMDFLTKPFKDRELVEAIHRAMEKDITSKKGKGKKEKIDEKINKLSPREREIVPLVTAGVLNKVIASKLKISETTVKMHRRNIMSKLEVKTLAELIRMTENIE